MLKTHHPPDQQNLNCKSVPNLIASTSVITSPHFSTNLFHQFLHKYYVIFFGPIGLFFFFHGCKTGKYLSKNCGKNWLADHSMKLFVSELEFKYVLKF